MADGQFHDLAVTISGSSFGLFVDGELNGRRDLTAALEDGPGVFQLGDLSNGDNTGFSGTYSI